MTIKCNLCNTEFGSTNSLDLHTATDYYCLTLSCKTNIITTNCPYCQADIHCKLYEHITQCNQYSCFKLQDQLSTLRYKYQQLEKQYNQQKEYYEHLLAPKNTTRNDDIVQPFDQTYILGQINSLTPDILFKENKYIKNIIHHCLYKNNQPLYKLKTEQSNIFIFLQDNIIRKDKNCVKLLDIIYRPLLRKTNECIPLYVDSIDDTTLVSCVADRDNLVHTYEEKYNNLLQSKEFTKQMKVYLI